MDVDQPQTTTGPSKSQESSTLHASYPYYEAMAKRHHLLSLIQKCEREIAEKRGNEKEIKEAKDRLIDLASCYVRLQGKEGLMRTLPELTEAVKEVLEMEEKLKRMTMM